jgi:hypothetical protein
MASFETTAFISQIKYLPNKSVLVFLDEYHKGYKKADGTIIEDKYLSYKTVWKPYFSKYINEHFSQGMLVQVKGEMLPYAIEKDVIVEGYTIIGQCMNLASYPRSTVKMEQNLVKESLLHGSEIPNIDEYNKPDF